MNPTTADTAGTVRTARIAWTESRQIESILAFHGVKFTLAKDFPIARVDVEGSRHNRARHDQPLIDRNVDNMVEAAYVTGLVLPPLMARIVTPPPSLPPPAADAFLMDGNNRIAALSRLGVTHVWAYVVDGPDDLLDEITRQINLYVGVGATENEQFDNAVTVARRRAAGGAPTREIIEGVARAFLLKPDRLADRIRLYEYRMMLDSGGAYYTPGHDRVPDQAVMAIMGMRDTATAASIVASLVDLQNMPSVDSVRSIVAAVRLAGRAAAAAGGDGSAARRAEAARQMAGLRTVEATRAGRPTNGPREGPALRIKKDMARLTRTLTTHMPASKHPSTVFTQADQADVFVTLARELAAVLVRAADQLRPPAPPTTAE